MVQGGTAEEPGIVTVALEKFLSVVVFLFFFFAERSRSFMYIEGILDTSPWEIIQDYHRNPEGNCRMIGRGGVWRVSMMGGIQMVGDPGIFSQLLTYPLQ